MVRVATWLNILANQTQNLAAILSNFQTVIDATSTSLNDSLGSAIQENSRYMESLEAQTNNLKAEFQDLANNVIDKELVSGALKAASAALEILNTDVGQAVVQWGLLSGVLIGAITIFGTIAAHLNPIYLVVAGITALGVAVVKLYEHFREGDKPIEEFNAKIDESTAKLEKNKQRIEEINALNWVDKTPEILSEKESLEQENETLEKNIDKYEKLAEAKARAILAGTDGDTTNSQKVKRGKRGDVRVKSNAEVQAERMAKKYAELTQRLQEYQRVLNTNHELTDEQAQDYNNLITEASRYTTAMESVKGGVASCTAEQQALYNQFQVTETAYSDAQGYISNYVSSLIEEANKTKTAEDNLYDLAAQMVATNDQGLNFSQQIAALQQLANQAGYTASAMAAVFGLDETTMMNQVRTSATGYMRAGLAETSEEAMAMAKEKYINDMFTNLKAAQKAAESTVINPVSDGGGSSVSKATTKAKEEVKDAVEEVKDTTQDAVEDVSNSIEDALNEQKQMMQGVIDYYVEYASRKIDEIQDKLDEINDKYDAMLDAAEERAQAQLDALEAENNAIEDQITLQDKLNALDKAKNTMQMVYKDGQFVYQADADEVSKSQNELNAYYRQKDYENRKKYIEDSLAAEKDYIETLRKNETAALEDEKKRWEEYKDGWSNLVSEYEYQQNKLLADQMFGADQENATWQTRLANLQSFVTQYNSLMGSLYGFSGGGSGGYGVGGTSGSIGGLIGGGNDNLNTWDLNSAYNSLWEEDKDYGVLLEDAIKKGYGVDWISGVAGQRNAKIKALGLEGQVEDTQSLFDRLKRQYGYTDGYTGEYGTSHVSAPKKASSSGANTSSSKTDNKTQSNVMAIEDKILKNSQDWFNATPAEQERLHAENEKLRKQLSDMGYANGTTSARGGLSLVGEKGAELRVLNQGDGIIPADITRNLWSFGKNPAGFMRSMSSTVLNISNVSLPSVRNAQQFVEGLKELAIQRTYGNN